MEVYCLASSELTAVIKAQGAELCSLRDKDKNELLWQAGPAWPRHAPNLFPIVGSLHNDRFRHQGREYQMTRHGFARDRQFSWGTRVSSFCNLYLIDDCETRQNYPFPFRFDIAYSLSDQGLGISYTVTNTGDSVLPASFGAHPAFRWPLNDGTRKDTHRLIFSHSEQKTIRRLRGGLLAPEPFAAPFKDNILSLHENLFVDDVIILEKPASNSVAYTSPTGSGIRLSWDAGFRELALWSPPSGDFLCIEPWHGTASPTDFDGEITQKPSMMLIPPGESREANYRIDILRQANDDKALSEATG